MISLGLLAARITGFPFLLILTYAAIFFTMLYISTLEVDLIHASILGTIFLLVLIHAASNNSRSIYTLTFMILQCASIFFNIIFCLCYIYANQVVWDIVADGYEVTNNALLFSDCLMLLGITYGDNKRINYFSA
jgi:hypothetical protein